MSVVRKVVLITGGNAGLGLEVVRALYASQHAYDIIIGSRSISNGEKAIETVKKEIPSSASILSTVSVDLASDSSIESAIKAVADKSNRLDVLINNGGANFDNDITSGAKTIREAFNASWDINVAGTQVLTHHAVPLLLKSNDPRLMFVTSGTSTIAETERFDNPISQRINASPDKGWPKPAGPNPITAYRSSKTGLNMLMREWNRILLNDGVKVWCISPGFLATGLGGLGVDKLKKMGAQEPSVGGHFIKDVVEGKRDADVGKVIRKDMIQPW